MSEKAIQEYNAFKIYQTIIGGDQAYITASVVKEAENCKELVHQIYQTILQKLTAEDFEIVHERLFGHADFYTSIITERNSLMQAFFPNQELPFTFIYLKPIFGASLAGVQIRAIKKTATNKVWPIEENGKIVGRGWSRNGAKFLMLQNMHGDPAIADRYTQTCDMFQRVQTLIKPMGASFENVARTWIYLQDILDWYDVFNKARNFKFTEFGILGEAASKAIEEEQIFLPASTGILGANPQQAYGTMDVFVILPTDAVKMAHISGLKQKSPYRYGSAFSRAMTMKETDVSHILLSGTASIDEAGKTVFLDDSPRQIEKTFQVIEALLGNENATFANITEATVFFKCGTCDFGHYEQITKEMQIKDLPGVFVQADVCRDDLLFEIDAAISY